MEQPQDELLIAWQGNVSRKMGRCILRLQQYERLLNSMLAAHDLGYHCDSAPARVAEPPPKSGARRQKPSLGQRVSELSEAHPASGETDAPPGSSQPSSRLPTRAELSEKAKQDWAALVALVALRNHLVHHFMEQFDLFSDSGCRAAELCLDEAYQRIDRHDRELRGWVTGMEHGRERMPACMQSTEWRDVLLYGLVPGQPVDWPRTSIVQQLTRAERDYNEAGWTSLAIAIGFIRQGWPDLTPRKYGCSSWRHLIHQSGLFEIQKRKPADSERTQVWYRSKPALS